MPAALMLAALGASAQQAGYPRFHSFLDATGTIGASQGTAALSAVFNRRIGKRGKWELGLGTRLTFYTGEKKDFITSGPAKYTRTFSTPFAIFFAGQREENFDTLQVQRPLTNAVNITINIGYHLSSRFYAGFNIDVIGATFGRTSSAEFYGIDGSGQQGNYTTLNARPTRFNLLLTGDHDKGTLNSEFFLKYQLSQRWAAKAVYQFIFIEYQSGFPLEQHIPNGPLNNRFRNKANTFGLGLSYDLFQKPTS